MLHLAAGLGGCSGGPFLHARMGRAEGGCEIEKGCRSVPRLDPGHGRAEQLATCMGS